MMLFLLLGILILVVLSIPLLLLFGLPVWAARRLHKRGRSWRVSLVPLLVPLVTLASELYPAWLVHAIAKDAMRDTRREALPSVYPEGGFAEEAAHLVATFPSLRFAEGLVDSTVRLGAKAPDWALVPDGPVRFHGRRPVGHRQACRKYEVIDWVGDPTRPIRPILYCTRWMSVRSIRASHALRSDIRAYNVGPYRVTDTSAYAARRDNAQAVNAISRLSVTGGIWWNLTEWLGEITGARMEAINMVGQYEAATVDLSGLSEFETFLVTGRDQPRVR